MSRNRTLVKWFLRIYLACFVAATLVAVARAEGVIYTVNGNTVMRCQIEQFSMNGQGDMMVFIPSECVQAIDGTPQFDDVPPNHWAINGIRAMAYSGISTGCGDNNYCPDNYVTRAELAVMLQRGLNLPDYPEPTNFVETIQ